MKYEIPREHIFRLHHIRPRFKDNCEEVLLYMAEAITEIGDRPTKEFKELMRQKIRQFPGNIRYTLKTIDNWRTEISSLFALYFEIDDWTCITGLAEDLASSKDLSKFFKYFIYNFQYPGGHLKPR